MQALEIMLSILMIGSIVFYVACALLTIQFFSRTEQFLDTPDVGVSVLVPVCGVDVKAWENWLSICQQNYTNYEVLFGVMNPRDPSIPILKELIEKFPDRTQLLTELEPLGINHKDSNLSYLLAAAQHEVIIFADSDIWVNPEYIRTVTARLANSEVGLVTCVVVGHEPQFLSAALASMGRCVDFIPSLLIAQWLDRGLRCAVGATIATRRSTLAQIGGLQFDRIGSDYDLGKRTAQAGYRVELSHYVLESDTGNETIGQLFLRELRWARTIRCNHGYQYYGMVFCYGTVYCIPLLILSGVAKWAIVLSLITIAIRLVQVGVTVTQMNCLKLLQWLWALPLRDMMSFFVWSIGGFGRSIYWRGRWLQIEDDKLTSSH